MHKRDERYEGMEERGRNDLEDENEKLLDAKTLSGGLGDDSGAEEWMDVGSRCKASGKCTHMQLKQNIVVSFKGGTSDQKDKTATLETDQSSDASSYHSNFCPEIR